MNDEIESELKNRMILAGLSIELPVAYPNVEFTPPDDGSGFIDFQIVWADNRVIGLKGQTEQRGRLIMVLAMPLNRGSLSSASLAREIAAVYPANLTILLPTGGYVRIEDRPSIRTGYRDGLYWRTPIVAKFQSMQA